ncbi:hypothetical protein CNEO3_160048 [Clostridium neonatale]|uniref:Uncharacterized protein n=1 Tax=Clostridium neonatale TaxID=137838 RepID=A0AA86K253_9CLOT|nr:hypothetical protein CNEO_44233 [Clostridium neonatale]CAG9717340.1 hypothetical protein CNEO_470073 [Clostridium neonatale]CAI3193643.1 hypothetical protein CNEO2_110042 [Clostridium neonatale]CAI3211613.1 hypothetical protein CNEO2_520042 [Clostridium neonatale]CAI3213461.1 hypothetical protein CNEO2_80043 [Clostridium neonatale]
MLHITKTYVRPCILRLSVVTKLKLIFVTEMQKEKKLINLV